MPCEAGVVHRALTLFSPASKLVDSDAVVFLSERSKFTRKVP